MRVQQYLTSRNIGLESLHFLCEYLCLDYVKANFKCSESRISLFDEVLSTSSFQEWLKTKWNLEKLRVENAQSLIERIQDWSEAKTDDILAERILNALDFLIKKSFFYTEKINIASGIIYSDKCDLEKMLLLKQSRLFNKSEKKSSSEGSAVKANNPVIPPDYEDTQDMGFDNNHDPYENFRWNGLSGEEAYMASLNHD